MDKPSCTVLCKHRSIHRKNTQVDAIRPGLLGKTRDAFAIRYCARKLVPVRSSGGESKRKYDNSGLSHPKELHALLKQVLLFTLHYYSM